MDLASIPELLSPPLPMERQIIYARWFWENNKQISALLFIHIDGASRGNPGSSGIGIVIVRDSHTVTEYREFIGTKTNNQAEYLALKKALEVASSLDSEVTILSDSELIINQRLHYYKVRNKQLKELFKIGRASCRERV